MRLSKDDAEQIKRIAEEIFGSEVTVCLFGSRVDDAVKGGDVDLFIESPIPVPRPAYSAALMEARTSRLLHGRKVDVVIAAPNLTAMPIHREAKQTGVPL